MTTEGPILETLTHRLAECPPDILAEPRIGKQGLVHVDAVVYDLIRALGGPALSRAEQDAFRTTNTAQRNTLRITLIAAWLLYDDWFRAQKRFATTSLNWLNSGLAPLAAIVSADLFVRDSDRREELARHCLAALNVRPTGETESQAEDRLEALDSVKRVRIIRDTREKQAHARKLREKMREKEALEAAAKAGREY